MVDAVPCLRSDLMAPNELFLRKEPAHCLVHRDKVKTAKFAFGDASGRGFGSSCDVFKINTMIMKPVTNLEHGMRRPVATGPIIESSGI